jgi:hypothetical protein
MIFKHNISSMAITYPLADASLALFFSGSRIITAAVLNASAAWEC